MSSIAMQGGATGSGTVTLLAPVTNTNRTINLPDSNGTVLTTATAGVPVNGPAFSAYASSNQTISTATFTKIQFQTEEFDTASAFDNATNYRFTPQVAGYYQVNAEFDVYAGGIAITSSLLALYKNGSGFKRGTSGSISSIENYSVVSTLVYLNGSTDYLEIYANVVSAGTIVMQANAGTTTYFQAFLARSAT